MRCVGSKAERAVLGCLPAVHAVPYPVDLAALSQPLGGDAVAGVEREAVQFGERGRAVEVEVHVDHCAPFVTETAVGAAHRLADRTQLLVGNGVAAVRNDALREDVHLVPEELPHVVHHVLLHRRVPDGLNGDDAVFLRLANGDEAGDLLRAVDAQGAIAAEADGTVAPERERAVLGLAHGHERIEDSHLRRHVYLVVDVLGLRPRCLRAGT